MTDPAAERALPDIAANRRARKWSRAEIARRCLWAAVRPLFAWSPRIAWGWRVVILRIAGATIGRDVRIEPTVRISMPWNLRVGDFAGIGDSVILYCLGAVTIGERATLSQYAHVCAGTHDHRQPELPLVKTPVTIGCGAWVCADAFVGPGTTIGDGAIVGARAVAMSDVPAGAIVIGNPARLLKTRNANG